MSFVLVAYLVSEIGAALILAGIARAACTADRRRVASPAFATMAVSAVGLSGALSHIAEPGALWPLCGAALLLGMQAALLLAAFGPGARAREGER